MTRLRTPVRNPVRAPEAPDDTQACPLSGLVRGPRMGLVPARTEGTIRPMDALWNALSALGGLAAALIAARVWRNDHLEKVERQARAVSAWVVREVGRTGSDGALRGVVVQNGSGAPISRVGVLVDDLEPSGRASDSDTGTRGQLYTQIPPGTYYLQRNVDDGEPWSAPHAVDLVEGQLRLVVDGEPVRLAPVTEVPAKLRLVFLGFRDTANRQWWRVGMGELTQTKPPSWNDVSLLRTAVRELPPAGRRGRSAETDSTAELLRETANLLVHPDQRVDPAELTRREVAMTDSPHPIATHVARIGLTGGTGMSLRLLTEDSTTRDDHVYYLEAGRDGALPVKFFYGHLNPDTVVTPLRAALVLAGSGHDRAADWTPETLAAALTRVVREHQLVLRNHGGDVPARRTTVAGRT